MITDNHHGPRIEAEIFPVLILPRSFVTVYYVTGTTGLPQHQQIPSKCSLRLGIFAPATRRRATRLRYFGLQNTDAADEEKILVAPTSAQGRPSSTL